MSKKSIFIGGLSLAASCFLDAQTTVYGYIKDEQGKPIERVDVDLKESDDDVLADKIGYFQLVDLKPGDYQIVVYKNNYETKVVSFSVKEGEKRKDLGVIVLPSVIYNNSSDQGFTLLDDNDEGASQSTVGLLQSSQDIFNKISAYDLGIYWFRPRGLDSRSGEIMFNGVSMLKQSNGNLDFSSWGGLNEITRYPEIAINHTPSEYAFGGVSSVIYKNTKASEYRKGSQLTYSLTNRNYRHRLSYRYTSGMNKKGWAFTGMLTRRWANEGVIDGTFYDSYAAYLGLEKKINSKHTLTFNAIVAPTRRAGSSPNTQELYDYMGIKYNAYWGWQDGKKRSERVRETIQPILQLTDYWKISDKSQLWTTLSYQFGKNKSSRLDWYKAENPSPIYYKKLPSYDASTLQRWLGNNQEFTQINWNKLYGANLYTTPKNYDGIVGRRAIYYLVDDVSDDKIWNVSTHFSHNFNDKTRFFLNVNYQNYKSNQYREVNDLLGADFAINKDAFANNPELGFLNKADNNHLKREGDKIGYDYTFGRQEVKINPSLKFSVGKFDVMVSGLLGYSTSYRKGHFEHYLYSDSYGKSKDYNYTNYGLKGQIVYKINGRNFLVYNGTTYTSAPFLEDLFFNPRVNSAVIDGVKNMVVNANDVSYVISTPFVKAKLTGYLISTENEVTTQRYYADGIALVGNDANVKNSGFVTQVMKDVSRQNVGVELGLEVKATSTLSLQALASYGEYIYTNNPKIYFGTDAVGTFANGKPYTDVGQAYLDNYRQGGTPQMALLLGFKYNSPKYWWFGANWNYFDHSYLDPSALIRTDNFVTNPTTGAPYPNLTESELRRVLAQKKLPTAFFINANAGKSWLIGKYYLLISASVNNILNNRSYITSGFEQTRKASYKDYVADFDKQYPQFAPKYWYNQGRSYFINLQFRF